MKFMWQILIQLKKKLSHFLTTLSANLFNSLCSHSKFILEGNVSYSDLIKINLVKMYQIFYIRTVETGIVKERDWRDFEKVDSTGLSTH